MVEAPGYAIIHCVKIEECDKSKIVEAVKEKIITEWQKTALGYVRNVTSLIRKYFPAVNTFLLVIEDVEKIEVLSYYEVTDGCLYPEEVLVNMYLSGYVPIAILCLSIPYCAIIKTKVVASINPEAPPEQRPPNIPYMPSPKPIYPSPIYPSPPPPTNIVKPPPSKEPLPPLPTEPKTPCQCDLKKSVEDYIMNNWEKVEENKYRRNVTDIVKKFIPVKEAYVYVTFPLQIVSENGPWYEKPPSRKENEMVLDWMHGFDRAIVECSDTNCDKNYWIITFKVTLDVTCQEGYYEYVENICVRPGEEYKVPIIYERIIKPETIFEKVVKYGVPFLFFIPLIVYAYKKRKVRRR